MVNIVKRILRTLLILGCLLLFAVPAVMAKVAIFCYHEVDRPNDAFAVSSGRLEAHLKYLKKEGYHFVTLNEYLAYTDGKLKLPDKSVMITFDDGYRSFYTKVYPLLKKYDVPAMLAIVTSWTDGEGLPTDVRAVATWDELKEMEKSGLVTVVSHSHALHKQQVLDPQGDRNGIAGARLYLNGRYETDEEYIRRLDNDMAQTQAEFRQYLGHPSKVMVWPYGIYSGPAIDAAARHGMTATFLLDGGVNPADKAHQVYARRMIISSDTSVRVLKKLLTKDHDTWNSKPLRMAQIDIDNLYDANPLIFRRNITNTLSQLQASKVNVVALQAFADPDGDGNVDAVYFYNHELPVVADIFNTVATAIQQQNITVIAWMPGLAYTPFLAADGSNMVQGLQGKTGWYRRLSPFDEQGLQKVQTLYGDLGRYTTAQGVLLQDDLYLNDFEDASPVGQQAYQKAFGQTFTAQKGQQGEKWVALKTERLNEAADKALKAFRQTRPNAITMRDVYSAPVLNPKSREWFAQDYRDCLKRYDYTVVMAYPQMDHQADAQLYLQDVAQAVKKAGGTDKTIVKIQSYDWEKEKWLDKDTFQDELKTLKKSGIRNVGVYPQTFHTWGK